MDIDIKDIPIKAKIVHSIINVEIGTSIMLKQLRGRASVTILSRERTMIAKLEGYPVVRCKIHEPCPFGSGLRKFALDLVVVIFSAFFKKELITVVCKKV